MGDKENSSGKWIDVLRDLYGKGREKEYNDEKDDISKIIVKLEEYLKHRYQLIKPFEIGGTGILFLVEETYSKKLRALKFSRPLPEAHKSASLIKEEGDKLTNLVHPNIIDVYEVDALEYLDGHEVAYFIMDYVKDAMDLKKKILFETFQRKISIAEAEGPAPVISAKIALEKLYSFLHGLASGLEFMHNNKFLHFDIKPENFLIDNKGIPRVTDLGYAKEKIENSGVETRIGFTLPYAHPDLFKYDYQKTDDPNRLRAAIKRSDFKYEWDIYALGQSILELLELIDKFYPDDAIHLSLFRYLHLMACRMLDGYNHSIQRDQNFFNEMALGLSQNTFQEIQYKNMSEIRKDLEKEMSISLLDHFVPELNFLSRKTLHGAETRSTTFTPRLKRVVEHPLFSRLSHISQLGMIRYIYPTANHTRYDHSIGTYTNASAYVVALYNDSENPLFKQLVTEEDIKAVLLASLLHDLGQYPLAHDFEEVAPTIFGHDDLSIDLLKNSDIVDNENRTLKQIIEDKVFGWSVPINRIIEIIEAKPLHIRGRLSTSLFKTRLLSSIINGPIDADKVDYLLRDSRECRLNYGQVIDFERLMKTITVAHDYDKNYRGDNVSLAVYDKGRACAESIAFARYLLFSAVYWHHTSRAYKAMIHQALRLMLQSYDVERKKSGKVKLEFLKFVIALYAGKKKNQPSLISHLKEENYRTLICMSDLEILDWVYQRSPEKGLSLLQDLGERRLYKRLASIHFTTRSPRDEQLLPWEKFQNANLSNAQYIKLCDALQEKLLFEVRHRKDKKIQHTISLEGEKFDRFEELMDKGHISILIDIPNPMKYTGSITLLRFIKETMEKRYLDDLPEDFMVQVSEVWSTHISELMKSLAVVRIFCHPEVRHAIKATLAVSEIIDIAHAALKETTGTGY